MEVLFQVIGVAVVATVCCCIVRPHAGAVAALLSASACVLVLGTSIGLLEPILSIYDRMQNLSGLAKATTAPILKAAGIGILVRIAGAICEDTGEITLLRSVEITGTILTLHLSVPLISAVLDLLEDVLGG